MSETQFTAWEPEYNHRGTFTILLTCLTTLGFCVWSAIHLSIPRKKPSTIKRARTQLVWVSIGLFLPELLILAAFAQRLSAAKLKNLANKTYGFAASPKRSVPWYKPCSSTSVVSGEDQTKMLPENKENPLRQHRWTLVHGFYAKMGGFAFDRFPGSEHDRVVLSAQDIIHLLENKSGIIPDISEATILDRSKADALTKTLLFVQVAWFCVNSLARLLQRLPLTLLEVTTLAHAFCSMTAYVLWWDKPLNIREPTLINSDGAPVESIGRGRTEGVLTNELSHVRDDLGFIRTFSVASLVSVIYGVPHLLAWYVPFPTQVEQTLWRIAATFVTLTGVVTIGLGILLTYVDKRLFRIPDSIFLTATSILCLFYFPSSLYLFVESFRQLSYLPVEAFQTTVWAHYFPHFG